MSIEKTKKGKLQKILAAKLIIKNVKKWVFKKKAKSNMRFIVNKIRTVQIWYRSVLIRKILKKRL